MKEFKHGSKKQLILEYLKKGNSITPIEAFRMFTAIRLNHKIKKIVKLGYDIHAEIVHNSPYPQYTIPKFVKRKELEELTSMIWNDLNFLNDDKQERHNIEITDENIDEVIAKVKSGLYFCTPF